MGRGLGELQRSILAIIERERANGLTSDARPSEQLDAAKIATELFGDHASDTDRRGVARGLQALERRGLIESRMPPMRRFYF